MNVIFLGLTLSRVGHCDIYGGTKEAVGGG